MPLRRAPLRRRAISVTSLVDVIFLLLLFFMLTSTFTRFAELPIAGAGSGAGASDAPPLFLALGAEALTLNGRSLTLAELPGALEPLAEAASALLVSPAPGVDAQRLVDLLTALADDAVLPVRVLE